MGEAYELSFIAISEWYSQLAAMAMSSMRKETASPEKSLGDIFMAGSYRNITQTDGTPKENFGVGSSLDNEGDVVEALQKCYGMIWWLAIMLCEQHTSRKVAIRDSLLACIKLAETNAGVGRERGESGQ